MRFSKWFFKAAFLPSIFVPMLASTSPASAQFAGITFFGDSNSDSGRYLFLPEVKGNPATFATFGGYTTNPGPMWSVALGSYFGLPVTPSDAPGGGNNFAAGGARITFEDPTTNEWSTASQIAAYFATTGGVANPNALYVYSIGVNDLKPGTTGGLGNIVNPPDFGGLTTLAHQAASQVAQLSAAGARFILVPNTISIASQAAGVASGFGFNANIVESRGFYDQTVWGTLAAEGIRFIPGDFNSVYNYVLLNPTPFGITNTNVNTPACGATTPAPNCGPGNLVTPNAAQTFFYADGPLSSTGGGHLTTAMQKVEADYYFGLLSAPSQISFLTEAPIQTRLGVINAINNQIPLSFGTPGTFHGWVSGDVSWLKMTNNSTGLPNDPGTPVAATAGFDYAVTSDWLVGAAFSGLTTSQSFSIGGNYTQNEFAISLYTAWRHNAFWADAIATWGTLQDGVNRQVPLGITLQSNQGSTNGSNTSIAGEFGYSFTTRIGTIDVPGLSYKAPAAQALLLTHGPIVGAIFQQVYLNGYTEINSSGAPTALSFGSQTRNSAISELGYQASVRYGIWEPYARATWDHEWADLNRDVTAALTSIAAPAFTMPAVILGRDWAEATVGTRVKLGDRLSGYVAVIAELGQNHVTTYGGQVGLNYALDPAPVTAKF
jgi:outer membrane lipase/esterase